MAGSRSKGDEARVTVEFNVPLEFAFRWCTDYTPQDAALEGEKYERKVIERSARRVVLEDLDETDSGWVWAHDVVTLRPPNRWHMESLGSHRNAIGDYVLTKLPNGRTRFELRWWRKPTSLGRKISRAERERETRKAWKQFAKAMEKDYREAKKG